MDFEELRRTYRPGTRVELDSMDDPYAPPVGTCGTVLGVDAIGDILVDWDGIGSLNVIPDVDKIHIIAPWSAF